MSNVPKDRPDMIFPGVSRFAGGQLVATPGALSTLADHGVSPMVLLTKHFSGDWGEVSPDDAAANEAALVHGSRLLSRYTLASGVSLWVITEWDRSTTTILLPSEY